jgi:Tfp pilus assembly protein PilZ
MGGQQLICAIVSGPYPIARRSERIVTSFPVKLLTDVNGQRRQHSAHTLDISKGGVRVRTDAALEPGRTVTIILESEHVFPLRGRVVWVNRCETEQEIEAGQEFLD